MLFPVLLLSKALLLWLGLLTLGLLARVFLNSRTMREEYRLRRMRIRSGLTGQELFTRVNREYDGIFRLDYSSDRYGEVLPTAGLSRLAFALDVFRKRDHGTVLVPRACCDDDSLMAASLISHETGHLIQLMSHPFALLMVILQRFVTAGSSVASVLCFMGFFTFHVAVLSGYSWYFFATGILVPIAWMHITVSEWGATVAGLRAAQDAGALTGGEAAECKRIGRLWLLTYLYKLYIYSIPVVVMALMGLIY